MLLRQFVVLGPVGRVPVVEADVKAVEIGLAAGGDLGHEGLRRLARLLGRDHDRRAVGIVGADEVHLVALHALEAHPDVGLDVLHHVADVERRVGVGQGGGDEELARHGPILGTPQCAPAAGAAAQNVSVTVIVSAYRPVAAVWFGGMRP